MKNNRTLMVRAAFLVYGLVMLYLLFGQRMGAAPDGTYWGMLRANLNLKPMDTLRRFWWVLHNSTEPGLRNHAVVNLVGNVVMFVPLGLLTPCIWGKMRKFWVHFLCMLLIIVCIEVLQLFTLLGSCDVDDLLLNLSGVITGYGLWKLIEKMRK